MSANDEIARLDSIPKSELDALLGVDTASMSALTEKKDELVALAGVKDALVSLAGQAAELLALLDGGDV